MIAGIRYGKFAALLMQLMMLIAAAGCAHRPIDEKIGVDARGSLGSLQEIRTASNTDYDRVEITADRVLTYTFYKLPDPPVAVIDLSDVTPGAVASPIEVNTGNIGKIAVNRHDLAGGMLTRIEIGLKKDLEVSVTADPENKAKVLMTFHTPSQPIPATSEAVAAKAAEETPAAKPEAAPSVSPAPAEVVGELPVQKEQIAAAGGAGPSEAPAPVAAEKPAEPIQVAQAEPAASVPTEQKEQAGEARQDAGKSLSEGAESAKVPAKTLTALNATKDGVEMAVSGPVDNYKVFTLKEPARIVLDLFGVKSAIPARKATIEAFGVASARIGEYPDKTRIVFDATQAVLPTYEVVRTEAGLRLALATPLAPAEQDSAKTVVKLAAEKEAPPVATAKPAEKSVKSKVGRIDSLDFKVQEGMSRVLVKVSGDCPVEDPAKVAGGVGITVKNCALPRQLQRAVDTSAFEGPVLKLTPYQVRTKAGVDTKIVVKLRQDSEYSLKREDGLLVLAIKNPPTEEAPALVAEAVKPAETAPAPKPPVVAEPKPVKVPMPAPQSDPVVVQQSGDKKNYTGRRVTLEFADADIRKIFQLLAEVSNLNFLVGDDVSGTISMKLVNVPWDQALDLILEAKNLGMQREGNIVQIRPKDKIRSLADDEQAMKKARERAMELRTEIFDVNFAAVADVATQFNSLKSERGTITQDVRTNKVIVKDISTALDDMKFLLRTLDVPEKQVMIEARIVEATSTFSRDIGVQWGIHYLDGAAKFIGINNLDAGLGGVVLPPPSTGTSGPGAAVGMSFGKLTSNVQLDLKLSAAATAGLIKIISTPKVATLNNKAAKISQGQSIPYQSTSAEGTKTEFVEAALTLEVTPHITADGSIIMKIKASNNSPGTGSPPPINKKEATTELLVKNGETTVIGGIYVDNDTDSDTGVPFLQNIPLFGWLFKSNTKTKTKTELLIFITPRLMS